MRDEPGITPDHLGRIESIIESDGLLLPEEREKGSVRTKAENPNAASDEANPDDQNDEFTDEERQAAVDAAETAQLADAAAAAEGDPVEGAEGEPGDDGITSIAGLAEEFEVEETELLGSIMIDDGAGESISLGDVVDGYRRGNLQMAAFRNELEAGFQERVTEQNTKLDTELGKIAQLAKLLTDEASREFNVDWDTLRSTDPAGYMDLKEKKIRLDQMLMGAVQTFDRNSAERQGQSEGDRRRVEIREADLLGQKRPDLVKNEQAAIAFSNENLGVLKRVGFDDPTKRMNQIYDHRELLILNAAAKHFASLKSGAQKNLTQLRKSKGLRRPNLVSRRTARIDTANPTQEARKVHAGRLKKTGSVKDAASLIETFLKPS